MSDNDTIVARPRLRDVAALASCASPASKPVKLPKPCWVNCLSRATPIIFRLKTPTAACSIRGLRYGSTGPNSFTGEDVLELQGHGGPVILDLLLKRILTIPGLRIARPGEFSERAFLNDKLDLARPRRLPILSTPVRNRRPVRHLTRCKAHSPHGLIIW